ncbi:RNA-guided endonuclease TnpB family protein [Caulobacter sp. FWC2]|uniref:RNA-guided endonuclease InsQ/TnpB family protein n=1 Tax=Caulobacter sp. FWC2 TaxID=69664 RepID=UPI000C15398A|nr:RNA-guided endonuclease TnpB family protein [Caulobacter sp. FWC2]PIB91242.1 transposase [Caulobacter sp. FWC2]
MPKRSLPSGLVRSRSFSLHPTDGQAEKFEQFAGVARLVYNLALEQRTNFWRQYLRSTGTHISYVTQDKEVTQLRAEIDWVAAVPTDVTSAALRDLHLAFAAFMSGKKGYPAFRSKEKTVSFRVRGRETPIRALNAKWSEIRLPKIGWVKFRCTRMIEVAKSVTVSRSGDQWRLCIACETASKPSAPKAAIGIDRGVANTLALSTGELAQLPGEIPRLVERRKRAQKALSRKVRRSKRYARQRERVRALAGRIAAVRNDWLHRQTRKISTSFNHVALEALRVTAMTASAKGTVEQPGRNVAQKRGLNRAILEQAWGIFARQLEYKVEERGGLLVYVNPAYTSQTCSACGVVDARSRESQAVFRCVACGHGEHADVGAAKEILRRSTACLDVEGARRRPAEASTKGVAA